ncbi:MAG: DUF6141 family protein [Planctomycetota bacterium]
MHTSGHIDFTEAQRVRQPWLWILLVLLAAIAWYAFISQVILGEPFGQNPAPDFVVWLLVLIIGVGMPLLFGCIRLVTAVDDCGIHVRFFPFKTRTFSFADVKHCEPRRYRPLIEYGGWGWRWSPWRGWAYSISGKDGVQLELTGCKRVLIGTQRPEDLATAIKSRIEKRV